MEGIPHLLHELHRHTGDRAFSVVVDVLHGQLLDGIAQAAEDRAQNGRNDLRTIVINEIFKHCMFLLELLSQ